VRLATIPWHGETSAALAEGDGFAPVRALAGREDAADVLSLIHRPLSAEEVGELRSQLSAGPDVRLLPPITRPPKNLLCVGKNYVEHVREGAEAEGVTFEVPKAPIWFTKPHTAMVGSGAPVVHDAAFTRALDYEGELGVVIGTGGRGIAADRALEHVFGYTIVNDITARDQQQRRNQWFVGKAADGYAPCGPWVVTADEIADPQALQIRTEVDGEVRQEDTTANMIFDVRTLIADLSEALTLEPGDIIATGTPPGVAWASGRYLEPGSSVAVTVEGVGTLWNRVVTAS
jgi:2-keto-4-pentenoate hydratase/2-oxohepta-3-ene-1,7-dioic acid hydratase in catechol pathway